MRILPLRFASPACSSAASEAAPLVALSTTLYGAIAANVVFQPFAEKLGLISKYELNAMELVVRGVLAIQSGESPRALEQRLLTYLHPKKRPKKDKE